MAKSEMNTRLAWVYTNRAQRRRPHIAFWEEELRKNAGASVGPLRPSWMSRTTARALREALQAVPLIPMPTPSRAGQQDAGASEYTLRDGILDNTETDCLLFRRPRIPLDMARHARHSETP